MKTFLIIFGPDEEMACGHCTGYIYGYDEVICPRCGTYIDMDHTVEMTEKELDWYIKLKGE